MTQTPEFFEKNVDKFLNHFEQFEYITNQRGFNTIESINLFKIFMNHKYDEVNK